MTVRHDDRDGRRDSRRLGTGAIVRSGAVTSEGDIFSPESITPDLNEPDDRRAFDEDPMPDGAASSDRVHSTDASDGSTTRTSCRANNRANRPDEPTTELPTELPTAPTPVTQLPDAVRLKIIGWAAEVLSSARPIDIPTALARVARFAPAKRARLAAAALGQAVQNDTAFRALVAERAANATDDVGAGVGGGPCLPAAIAGRTGIDRRRGRRRSGQRRASAGRRARNEPCGS